MLRLRLGVTDGTFTEVVNDDEVPANAEVVTSMTTGLEQRNTNQNQQNNPLMGRSAAAGPGGPAAAAVVAAADGGRG